MTDEQLSAGAPRAAILPEQEVRQWIDQLTEAVRYLEAARDGLCDAIDRASSAPTACQLCGRTFGSVEVREGRRPGLVVPISHDRRFCQGCSSGAAYRELREKQDQRQAVSRRQVPGAG